MASYSFYLFFTEDQFEAGKPQEVREGSFKSNGLAISHACQIHGETGCPCVEVRN